MSTCINTETRRQNEHCFQHAHLEVSPVFGRRAAIARRKSAARQTGPSGPPAIGRWPSLGSHRHGRYGRYSRAGPIAQMARSGQTAHPAPAARCATRCSGRWRWRMVFIAFLLSASLKLLLPAAISTSTRRLGRLRAPLRSMPSNSGQATAISAPPVRPMPRSRTTWRRRGDRSLSTLQRHSRLGTNGRQADVGATAGMRSVGAARSARSNTVGWPASLMPGALSARPLAGVLIDGWSNPSHSPLAPRGAAGLSAGRAAGLRPTLGSPGSQEQHKVLAAVMLNVHSSAA